MITQQPTPNALRSTINESQYFALKNLSLMLSGTLVSV